MKHSRRNANKWQSSLMVECCVFVMEFEMCQLVIFLMKGMKHTRLNMKHTRLNMKHTRRNANKRQISMMVEWYFL